MLIILRRFKADWAQDNRQQDGESDGGASRTQAVVLVVRGRATTIFSQQRNQTITTLHPNDHRQGRRRRRRRRRRLDGFRGTEQEGPVTGTMLLLIRSLGHMVGVVRLIDTREMIVRGIGDWRVASVQPTYLLCCPPPNCSNSEFLFVSYVSKSPHPKRPCAHSWRRTINEWVDSKVVVRTYSLALSLYSRSPTGCTRMDEMLLTFLAKPR